MKINPYLNFDGQCMEAFRFYEKCLGGRITRAMTFGDSPMAGDMPDDGRDRMVHVRLEVDGMAIMGSDCPPGTYEQARGISVTLQIEDPGNAERVFHALAEDGTVTMEFGRTFWAERFGALVDRFGTPWMVNCEGSAGK
jgi:PhnB protein